MKPYNVIDEFELYLKTKQLEKLIDKDISENDFNGFLDFKSLVDESIFYKKDFQKQSTIKDELLAWKKYERNIDYSKKQDVREFEPFLTKGEVEDFIKTQLKNLVDRNSFVGLSQSILDLHGSMTEEQLKEVAKTHLNNFIKREFKKYTGLNFTESLKNSLNIVANFSKNITNETERNNFLETVGQYVREANIKNDAKVVFDMLKRDFPNTITNIIGKSNKNGIIKLVFDVVTDDSFANANISTIGNILKNKWTNYLSESILKAPLKKEKIFDIAIGFFDDLKKEVLLTKNIFKLDFNQLVNRVVNKRINAVGFGHELNNIIRKYGRSVFRTSLMELGIEPKLFSPLENLIVNKLSNVTTHFVRKFENSLINGVTTGIEQLTKGDVWFGTVINKFYELGRLAGDRNSLYKWVYGDTEHCDTCYDANNQVHRLSSWWKYGVIPQSLGSKKLKCGGFHCRCRLIRVTGTSFGRLDRIRTA